MPAPVEHWTRHGFDWSTFVRNVQQLRADCPRVNLDYGITVSALNITRLDGLLDALERECDASPSQMFLHSLQEPVFMRTQVLPRKLKHQITGRLGAYIAKIVARDEPSDVDKLRVMVEGVLSYMTAQDLTHELPNFVRRMDELDALRSESTLETLPELAAALQQGRGITGLLYRAKKTGRLLLGVR